MELIIKYVIISKLGKWIQTTAVAVQWYRLITRFKNDKFIWFSGISRDPKRYKSAHLSGLIKQTLQSKGYIINYFAVAMTRMINHIYLIELSMVHQFSQRQHQFSWSISTSTWNEPLNFNWRRRSKSIGCECPILS